MQWSPLSEQEPQPTQLCPLDPESPVMLAHLLVKFAQSQMEEILARPNFHVHSHLSLF